MQTKQLLFNKSSVDLSFINDKSINLIVTSPPYPMIDMWNDSFSSQGIKIENDFDLMYEEMHRHLNLVWKECDRVLNDNTFIQRIYSDQPLFISYLRNRLSLDSIKKKIRM